MNPAPYAVDNIIAEPGQMATGYAQVNVGNDTLSLPIAIVHGKSPGPVLSVTAGIHGGEYVPMLAVRAFVHALDPAAMSGTVLVPLQSSPVAFLQRAAFVNPLDGKNLNRSFPGDPMGGPTDRLAAWLWTNILEPADAYVDCHCGDLPESLDGFVGIAVSGNTEIDRRALAMADQFPVERTITTTGGGSTIGAAAAAGIPAVLVEIGELGRWTEVEVQAQLDGLLAVAAHLGILPATDQQPTSPHPVYEAAAGLTSQSDGLWFPALRPGEAVTEGQTIGTIEDAFGSVKETITSPISGLYVYGLTSLAIHHGDFIAAIIRPSIDDKHHGTAST